MAPNLTPLDQACLLVGRFALHFSGIESELNEAIRKLFELSPDSADTVCANIDFYKKFKIVNSALIDQDTEGNRRNSITALFKRIATANNNRQVFAHASFRENGTDGIIFERTTAVAGLKRTIKIWTEKNCDEMFAEMAAIVPMNSPWPVIAPHTLPMATISITRHPSKTGTTGVNSPSSVGTKMFS